MPSKQASKQHLLLPKASRPLPPLAPSSSLPLLSLPVPQYVKNQQLNARLLSLESSLARDVAAAERQADFNVKRHGEFVDAKYALEAVEDELEDRKEETVERLMRAVAVRNDKVARMKMEMDLKERNFKAYYPEWMTILVQIEGVVKEQ